MEQLPVIDFDEARLFGWPLRKGAKRTLAPLEFPFLLADVQWPLSDFTEPTWAR